MHVLSAGLLTTMQDLGRPGMSHLGVSIAGAADSVSFRLANRLVGNRDGAPALEMTLKGGRFVFRQEAFVALVGADFDSSLPLGRAVRVREGEVVEVGSCRSGLRCYLAVRGGFVAKYDLGSASTHLLSGLGHVVRRDDVFSFGSEMVCDPSHKVVTRRQLQSFLRVTEGSETELFSSDSVFRLLADQWRVTERMNRQGVRLDGERLSSPAGGVMESEGVALGAIQVPPDGSPVILFVDSQTTGGYPVIANVASVDLAAVGQLRPGSVVRFSAVTLDEALRLLKEQEDWIRNAV